MSTVMIFMFSACGGILIRNRVPVLTAYFSVLASGILGKGELFVTLPLEDCLTGPKGSSIRAGTGGNVLVAALPTAKH